MDVVAEMALQEVVRQRDYLLGLLVEREVPDRSHNGKRIRCRARLITEATRQSEESLRIREVGKS